MAYLLKNINETPCKIVLNCYISFFQLDTFRFVGFTCSYMWGGGVWRR